MKNQCYGFVPFLIFPLAVSVAVSRTQDRIVPVSKRDAVKHDASRAPSSANGSSGIERW